MNTPLSTYNFAHCLYSARHHLSALLRRLDVWIAPPDPLAGMYVKVPPPLVFVRVQGRDDTMELRYVEAAQVHYVVNATLATYEDIQADMAARPRPTLEGL